MNTEREQNRNHQQESDLSKDEKKRRDNPFKDAGNNNERNSKEMEEEIESVQEKKEAMTERD